MQRIQRMVEFLGTVAEDEFLFSLAPSEIPGSEIHQENKFHYVIKYSETEAPEEQSSLILFEISRLLIGFENWSKSDPRPKKCLFPQSAEALALCKKITKILELKKPLS